MSPFVLVRAGGRARRIAQMSAPLHVLALEPYYGGSHRAFLDGWSQRSQHQFTLLTLPPHKWKWRMRQSAPLFSAEVSQRHDQGESWDVVWASDMVSLAEFRGLAPRPVANLPTVLYFHENQLTYPVRFEKERDWHFGLTNLVSALAADEIWFNSDFHRNDLIAAILDFVSKMPDFEPVSWASQIEVKSQVQPPGVEVETEPQQSSGPLRIAWAARWEHDKGPELLFAALDRLMDDGVEFEIAVMGETFRESPAIFEQARERLGSRVTAWGFQAERADYQRRLAASDVFVSTAEHEFFGIAAVEAALLGGLPVLPSALSYPEVFADQAADQKASRKTGEGVVFHDNTSQGIAEALQRLADKKRAAGTLVTGAKTTAAKTLARYTWQQRAPEMDRRLADMVCPTRRC